MSQPEVAGAAEPEGSTCLEPATRGELIRAGVARAALLDHLLRLPSVLEVLDLIPSDPERGHASGLESDPIHQALERARDEMVGRSQRLERFLALTESVGLRPLDSWLPEFLEAAWTFRRSVCDPELASCALVNPSLAAARRVMRSWRERADGASRIRSDFLLRLMSGLLPRTELRVEDGHADWVDVFCALVEHACDRASWTRETTGADRLWTWSLRADFVTELELGDDPEVVHALVDQWAGACHMIVNDHTRAPLPRGHIPDNGWVDSTGQAQDGLRNKVRRWVGWYVDKEIRKIPRKEILARAFPSSEDPSERASELNRHIREVKRLLALSIPLDPGQPIRLWRLLEESRYWLETLPEGVK